jgi:hypothetical protein
VAWRSPQADGVGMSNSHLRAGEQSDRFGTWALVGFVILFLPFFQLGPFAPFAYGAFGLLPLALCAGATFGAVFCGLVGLVSDQSEQRRAALQGLLKASPALVVGGWYALMLWALLSGDWQLG